MNLRTQKSLPFYGGQAIVEGVMMRGQRVMALAVRAPDQSIVIESKQLNKLYQSKLANIPFLRGLLILWDALVLGIGALTFSVNVQAGEDEKIEGAPMILTLVVSLSMGIGLFFLLPAGLAYLTEVGFGLRGLSLNIIEGAIRLALLIGYVGLIGLVPDIRRVYGYHGAEHKTINAFEAGAELTVDSVTTFSRQHPRCGTAFLLTVVLLSIALFAFIGPLPIFARLLSRLLLIPFLAMLAYEYIRFTSRHMSSPWIRPLVAANLALQKLTTREPDEEMLEIAITAFKKVLQEERLIVT